MQMAFSLVAVVSLFIAFALVPVVGAVLVSMLFFGLFLLALVGVLGGSTTDPER